MKFENSMRSKTWTSCGKFLWISRLQKCAKNILLLLFSQFIQQQIHKQFCGLIGPKNASNLEHRKFDISLEL